MKTTVQLRAAKIPVFGFIAVHYWFVIVENSQFERWEIWQKAHRSKLSWGHLHQNLMGYDQGVGNGDSWLEFEWEENQGNLLREIIRKTPYIYPYNYKYRYYPGPNSNTYVQWVLNQANTNYILGKFGIGKNYS
jgi:hypothetical protein